MVAKGYPGGLMEKAGLFAALQPDELLRFNGATGKIESSGITTAAALGLPEDPLSPLHGGTGADTSGADDGDVLAYDDASGTFLPVPPAAGGSQFGGEDADAVGYWETASLDYAAKGYNTGAGGEWGSVGLHGLSDNGFGVAGESGADVSGFFQSGTGLNTKPTLVTRANGTSPLFEAQANDGSALLTILAAGAVKMVEQAEPAAPADGSFVLWGKDAGGGKTAVMVRFPTGASIQLLVEA